MVHMSVLFKKIIFFTFFLGLLHAHGQMTYDTSITANRKNIIRFNPMPFTVLGPESFSLGYERVFKSHQSISMNIGRLKMREFVDLGLDQFGIDKNRESGGYSFVIDYRRYFKKRNRGFAPDGLYWGPFYSYYWYNHDLSLTYTDPANISSSKVSLESEFRMYHFGLQLGYQFIIKKRVSVDLIFIGPSWGKYRADFSLKGNLEVDEENDLIKEYFDLVVEKYPGLGTLVKERNVSTSGHFSTNTFGMRYLIQIGVLF